MLADGARVRCDRSVHADRFLRPGCGAGAKTCCSAADAADAQRVADRLDIPFYALDFERDFGRIKDYFVDEYVAGRTPNPCVMCNIWLKFGKLWAYGRQVGADYVATGHYARIARAADGTLRVARARDRAKDQSYVLCGLRPELLPHVLFPVGEHSKAEIRAIAREQNLPVHDKPESQEICFVPDDDYLNFVASAGRITTARARSLTRKAMCWACTPESRASPSASGAAWESPWDRPVTWCRSSLSPARLQSAAANPWNEPASRLPDSTGKDPSPPGKFPAWHRSGPDTWLFPPLWNPFPTIRPECCSIHPKRLSRRDR